MLLEWIISSSQSPGIRLRCWSKLLRERDNREIPETWRQTTPGFLYGTDSVLRMLRELHDYIDHIPFLFFFVPRKHYQMLDYITQELPSMVAARLPLIQHRLGIMGHSMGGHGALVAALSGSTDIRYLQFED